MLAKVKLDQLKQEKEKNLMDQKIIDAVLFDLLIKVDVSSDTIPNDAQVILDSYHYKVFKVENEGTAIYYIMQTNYDPQLSKTVRSFQQISLVEDFDAYYGEIKSFNSTVHHSKVQGKGIYTFVLAIAIIILSLGLIGGFIIISELDTVIGLAAMISTVSFAAILFGIAKIIDLLSELQK